MADARYLGILSLSAGCDDLVLGHISHPESFALEHQRVNPQGIVSVLHCTQRNVQQPFTDFRSQLITDLISLYSPPPLLSRLCR